MARATSQRDWRSLPRKPWPDRFWNKVSKEGPIMPGMKTPCWPWTGARGGDGYGMIVYKGKVRRSHRVAYVLQKGPIPAGHEVCHKCDYPPCQRGDHLFTALHAGNMLDMKAKGRGNGVAKNRHSSILTDDDVRAIRKLRKEGLTLREIGVKYGLREGNVSMIARGLTFKEVACG